jgi:hypothetical protein
VTPPTHPDPLAALFRGETVWIEVAGSSMRPLLRASDRLRVRPNDGALANGMVVVAVLQGALVAHRVVAVSPTMVTLQGDAADAPDPPLRPIEVVGRVDAAVTRRAIPIPLLDGRAWPAWHRALPHVRRLRGRLRDVARRARRAACGTG